MKADKFMKLNWLKSNLDKWRQVLKETQTNELKIQ